MAKRPKISVFSFFSGIGLLDLGFEAEGFDVVFVNEYHEPFLDAYKHSRQKMESGKPRHGYHLDSIEEFLTKGNLSRLKGWVEEERKRGHLVLFIGGPPCPDFSVGGKNKGGAGENGRLTSTYFELIRKAKPDLFIFENVKGLFRTAKHRDFFETEMKQIHKTGYRTTYEVHNSLEFGVGQDRDRLICFGALQPHHDWVENFNLKSQALFNKKEVTIRVPKELTVQHWFKQNEVTRHPNGKDFFQPRAALVKFQTIEEGDCSKKSFKRLGRRHYSPTAAYGNNEVHIHPTLPRRISAAEALSIQSAPKEFELPVYMSLTNMFKSIGNAVPFLMARAIASEIKRLAN